MAKVKKNVIVQGLSGKFGGQVVFRQLRDGRTIVCKVPDFSQRVLSKDQKAHHARFKAGAAYAKAAAKTEPLYTELAAGTMKNAYNVALADFFHPPVIHNVERQGNTLRVQASDDVRVARVQITIWNGEQAVEQGEAAFVGDDWWEYPVKESGEKAIVEARDLAGNVVSTEFNLSQ